MRAATAAAAVLIAATVSLVTAAEPWAIGARGVLLGGGAGPVSGLHACGSYDDWLRFATLRFRQQDVEAAIKFLDQRCPHALAGRVVIEQVRTPPPDIPVGAALCLRPEGSPVECLWLDSRWFSRSITAGK